MTSIPINSSNFGREKSKGTSFDAMLPLYLFRWNTKPFQFNKASMGITMTEGFHKFHRKEGVFV